MSRPHIEFIQAQQLPWVTGKWAWPGAGVEVKILSEDEDSGACSAIVRYPAGWQQAAACWLDAAEELYVLEGELLINGERHGNEMYAWLPPGYSTRRDSPQGAVVLTFLDRRPTATAGEGSYDPDQLILGLDAYQVPWKAGFDPAYASVGLRSKTLRMDEARQDRTFLVSCPPHMHPPGWAGPQEHHDCIEESFLIAGDFLSNVGTMKAGAYFWRPPHIDHGPYGSRMGNLTLIRTLGHKLENNWTEHKVAISREPAYTPALPEALAPLAGQPWSPPKAY